MNFQDIAVKWQKRWFESNLFASEPNPDKPKYFLTAAFPYPNSPQHIGHARTYSIADALARYKRMRGYNVLFPMAFHVTGTPIMAMAKRIEEKDEDLLRIFTDIYGMDRAYAESLTDPKELVLAFSKEIEEGMKEMGFSIDWRRKFYTFDPEFNSYVTWQFHKLKEAGVITKGKHQVPYCPKCKNVVGGHDTKGDVDPEIGEFVAIKFPFEDGYLVTATLRPETLYGVTNIWVNPESDYAKVQVDGEIYYVSMPAVDKLKMQDHDVVLLDKFKGKDLVGKSAKNPLDDRSIPIYEAKFVDPTNATGVVMSVPAHAPYDYVAFKNVGGRDEEIPVIIDVEDKELKSGIPAKVLVEKMGIEDQSDPKLEEATKTLYRKELHYGKLKVGDFAGLSVEDAREKVKEYLIGKNLATTIFEIMNRPVKCRCGGTVEVKILDDQWFINYGDPKWKEKALKCLADMKIIPPKRKKDLEYAINWLHEKACTRYSGLGTKFPFDESKMIEALSDSTIYMAFYTVKHLLKRPLSVEEWDYVLLGKGEGNPELEALRKSFEYWYPLDSRHSGGDLVYNHLPFFIFNHTAIFDESKWPKQIVINGFVLMDGQKMSKSLGNILPLRKAIREYGPDPIRISVVGGADLSEDTDFNRKLVEGITARLRFIRELANRTRDSDDSRVMKWLEGRFKEYAREAISDYEELDLRNVVHLLLYKFTNDVKWAIKRGGAPTKYLLSEWAKLMAPIAPHFADELWEVLGNEGFATTQTIDPSDYEGDLDPKLVEGEKILERVLEDVNQIKNLVKKVPSKVYIIVADEPKRKVFSAVKGIRNYNEAIKTAMSDPSIRSYGKLVLQWIKSAMKWGSEVILSSEDELDLFKQSLKFLESEISAPVEVILEKDAPEELKDKAKKSLPGKPSIYFQ